MVHYRTFPLCYSLTAKKQKQKKQNMNMIKTVFHTNNVNKRILIT